MLNDLDLSREDKEYLLSLLEEEDKRKKYNFISTFFVDDEEAITLPGCNRSLARSNYPKHIDFFKSGNDFTERAFIAGNQTGKTTTGLIELYYHCSGEYPDWWEGKRFNRPVVCWLCGDRGEIIRDGMQQDLLGRTEMGTGIIPLDKLAKDPESMPGVPGGKGQYYIKHKSGGISKIIIKTYQAGKNAFESAKVDVIMLDEECPMDIYVECQIRTITTGGTVYLTFTPDSGLTDTVLHFLDKVKPGEQARFVTMVGWDDVPHLSEERKKQLLATIPPHLRAVKTKGVPYLGAGAIYPIDETEFVIKPFKIPDYWPKAYGFDPSWNRTAAVWGAYEESTDTWYIYKDYLRGQSEPPIHVSAINSQGSWMQGVVDPHGSAGGKGVVKESFLEAYENLGLTLMLANPSGPGSVDLGINEVWTRLSTSRLKVFNTCQDWLFEFRIYRRNDKGQIVKDKDDLMDATRYLVLNGGYVMSVVKEEWEWDQKNNFIDYSTRSSITGY